MMLGTVMGFAVGSSEDYGERGKGGLPARP
jgi:hypothetical protein